MAAKAWRECFLSMPHIKKLQLSGHSASVIPTGIVYPTQIDGALVFHSLFPALESLELENVWFREPSPVINGLETYFFDSLVSSIRHQSPVDSAEGLNVLLPRRKFCHCCVNNQLKRLTVRRATNLYEDDVDLLMSIVPAVMWDRLERTRLHRWDGPEEED
ncbi:hypothetical protein OE88DRAFT_1662539 [Heliocybe sulcata]|uniref:Uncharacterized protein n=1 Tax=Heliocybe sulcata TaxID=5364 RepID=A0A5C3MXE3_9AGAM|nr:hypothetical protein OE88DRAFT_1662539 [Heliocybe sulcata]